MPLKVQFFCKYLNQIFLKIFLIVQHARMLYFDHKLGSYKLFSNLLFIILQSNFTVKFLYLNLRDTVSSARQFFY